ncbi:MAG: thioredoxin-dependent thiol peroxidase [Bacteroidota bacterium]|jgi:peroxiredoxin Q/BCP
MAAKKRIPKLKVGDKAPDFKVNDENGKVRSLKDFKGKKLVLFFYPKDNTSGCTKEACNLRDNYARLKKAGFEVVGVSTDSEKSHLGFIDKHDLPFTLLADTEKELVAAYDVWGDKVLYGKKYKGVFRTTFVINEKGVIAEVISDVDTEAHAAQILGE